MTKLWQKLWEGIDTLSQNKMLVFCIALSIITHGDIEQSRHFIILGCFAVVVDKLRTTMPEQTTVPLLSKYDVSQILKAWTPVFEAMRKHFEDAVKQVRKWFPTIYAVHREEAKRVHTAYHLKQKRRSKKTKRRKR
jgi:hypothetical protein